MTAMARWRGQWQWQDGEDDGKMAGEVKWWVRVKVTVGQEQGGVGVSALLLCCITGGKCSTCTTYQIRQ